MKIGPEDTEIALHRVKKEEITEVKYIARSASLPSGLNDASISCENFVQFGPVTSELTELICKR